MTTGTNATSVRVVKIGDQDHAVLSSQDPWYRYLEAVANLFLTGEIGMDDLFRRGMVSGISWQVSDPAAKQLERRIILTMDEPDCPCDPYRKEACACVPMNRRRRLAELMGVPYLEPLAGTDDDDVREGRL